MNVLLHHFCLAVRQNLGKQDLPRRPETQAVTNGASQVADYNRALTSKLAIAYAVVLEIARRNLAAGSEGAAVDLACGPGHFTLGLARQLGFRSVLGLDLAPAMIEAARSNAEQYGMGSRVRFELGDVTRLDALPARSFALTTFTMGAHHLATLDKVGDVLAEMHRITRPDGLIVLLDLARLRTADITKRYVGTLAADYAARGLEHLLEDFRQSMDAAWTVEEMAVVIPRGGRRWWQLAPQGLPAVQIVVGLPAGQSHVSFQPWQPWNPARQLVPAEFHLEWNLLRWLLFLGNWRLLP